MESAWAAYSYSYRDLAKIRAVIITEKVSMLVKRVCTYRNGRRPPPPPQYYKSAAFYSVYEKCVALCFNAFHRFIQKENWIRSTGQKSFPSAAATSSLPLTFSGAKCGTIRECYSSSWPATRTCAATFAWPTMDIRVWILLFKTISNQWTLLHYYYYF